MRIRKFRKGDARKVSNLIKRALYEVNVKDYPLQTLDFIAKSYSPTALIEKSKQRDIYVALEGEHIIGTAALATDYIGGTFVNPSYHGKGIGKKLVEHIEKVVKKRGVKKLEVPSSLTARRFYEKLGYKKKRKKKTKAGWVIIMEKWL